MSDQNPVTNSFGTATGTTNAVQFPDNISRRLKIKVSHLGVAGWVGAFGAATFPMSAGSDTEWVESDNLSDFWYKGTGAFFHYWIQS